MRTPPKIILGTEIAAARHAPSWHLKTGDGDGDGVIEEIEGVMDDVCVIEADAEVVRLG